MSRWYCPRGARRGLQLAVLTAAFWACWAAGYGLGADRVSRSGTAEDADSPIQHVRCSKHIDA